MPRTILASPLALLLACAFGVPAAAALDGGAGYGSAAPAHAPAVGDGGTLVVRPTVLAGNRLHVRGTLAGREAGRRVSVQRRLKDGSWRTTATTVTTADGAFDAVWKTERAGRFVLRAVPTPSAGATATAAAAPATGQAPVTVFRQAEATFFGPGFFGKRTACGQTLRRDTPGVAHRTLPCGTLVDLYYKGRTVTVPVVDRGPFREGTTWDLTSATAEALGMAQTSRIGALRRPAEAPAPAARR